MTSDHVYNFVTSNRAYNDIMALDNVYNDMMTSDHVYNDLMTLDLLIVT